MKTRNLIVGLAVTAATLLGGAALAAAAVAADDSGPTKQPASEHFIGKPRASVGATLTPAGELNVGVPTDVRVRITAGAPAQAMLVRFVAGEGLAIVAPTGVQQLAVTAGKPVETTVQVVPQSGGSLRLTAVVTLVDGAKRQTRPVSQTFFVKGPMTVRAGKAARTERDARGQVVEPMAGETRVRGSR